MPHFDVADLEGWYIEEHQQHWRDSEAEATGETPMPKIGDFDYVAPNPVIVAPSARKTRPRRTPARPGARRRRVARHSRSVDRLADDAEPHLAGRAAA
jgi:hypothetical protein